MLASGRMHDVNELGAAHFARGIAARLAGQRRDAAMPAEARAALAHELAGALMSMLTWWVRRGMVETPRRLDKIFHALVPGTRNRQGPGTRFLAI